MDPRGEIPKIVFEEERIYHPVQATGRASSSLTSWLMQNSGGLITSQRQAEVILLGCAMLAVFASVFILRSSSREAEFIAPPGQKIIYPENEPPRLQQR